MATLADSLELVLPALPDGLVGARDRAHAVDLARELPPVHRGGFEIRLGESSEVDFQQGITRKDDERRRLCNHVERATGDAHRWALLAPFAAAWADPSSPIQGAIKDLWLEFDRPPAASLSVFAGFGRGPGPAADRLRTATIALDALAGRAGWSAWRDGLERCFHACTERAFVSHLGLMVGRPSPYLRVNVSALARDELKPYLRDVGWPGDVEAAAAIIDPLRPVVAAVVVCLDVAERVSGHLAFECHINQQPPREPRWPQLLDALTAAGLCTAEKRDALLAWPGVVTPPKAPGPWPADLVRTALDRPADHFSCIARQLSHIKVTHDPAAPPTAKAYFGFLHSWLRPQVGEEQADRVLPAQPRRSRSIAAAVTGATRFLLASRGRSGLWSDFAGSAVEWKLRFGASDEWVTAYVAAALAGVPDEQAEKACNRAWAILAERRLPTGGWGYNRIAPVDADSTTWGLRLAAALGVGESFATVAGRRALARYRLADGGTTTYLQDAFGGRAVGNWSRMSHVCVTAAVAGLADEGALEYLRRTQQDDGSWRAYWWEDHEYATTLAAEALARTGRTDDRVRVGSAARWTLAQPASSPFAGALRARTLGLVEGKGAAQTRADIITDLLDRQEDDGGWPAGARMIAPSPDTDAPEQRLGTTDPARTFTTATVLAALAGSAAG